MTPSDLTKENEELKKELAAVRAKNTRLSDYSRCSMNCWKETNIQGGSVICNYCYEKLESELSLMRQERDAYRGALERVYNNGKGSEVYPKSHVQGEEATAEFIAVETVLAAYPKQKETT